MSTIYRGTRCFYEEKGRLYNNESKTVEFDIVTSEIIPNQKIKEVVIESPIEVTEVTEVTTVINETPKTETFSMIEEVTTPTEDVVIGTPEIEKVEIKEEVVEEVIEEHDNSLICSVCNFTAKSKAGLAVHKMKHKMGG